MQRGTTVYAAVGATVTGFASRSRGFDGGFAPRTHVEAPAPRPRTREEEASEQAARFSREVTALDHALEAVRQASVAKDPQRWREAKQALDRRLMAAHASRERVDTNVADAAVLQQINAAKAMLAERDRVARTLTEEPLGWTAVSREAELLAIAIAPIEGNVRDGWARKLAQLKSALASLSAVESRTLAARLRKQQPNDPLAMALSPGVRITRERFGELLAFLDGARQREALQSARHRTTPTRTGGSSDDTRLPSTTPATPSTPQPMDVLRLDPEKDVAPARSKPARRDEKQREVPREATRLYLQTNSNGVWRALRDHLQRTSWPAATDQLTWLQPKTFSDSVVDALHDTVMAGAKAGDIDLVQLDSLIHPLHVHDEIAGLLPIQSTDDTRSIAPSKHWIPALGLRFGQLVQSALVPSVVRMTQRYIDATNARAGQAKQHVVEIHAKDLITSSPLDRIVARGLVRPGVVQVVPDGSVKPHGRTSLRPVRLSWEGERDPTLWAWVRADLADATPEEVAASLFGYARDPSGDSTSYYAYGIAAAPPLFGLPASWAIRFPDARAHAPDAMKQGTLPNEKADTIASRLTGLAATDASDAIAIQQASGTPIGGAAPSAVLAAVDDTLIQLGALRTAFVPWGVATDIVPVILHTVSKRNTLKAAPSHEVMTYAAVAFGQRDRLARIAGSVAAAVAAAGKLSTSRDDENPLRPILAMYSRAAASAKLATACEDLIAAAEAMQRGLVIKALQANQFASMQAMNEMQSGPAMKDPAKPKDERTPVEIAMKVPAESHVPRTTSRAARELSRPYLDVQDRARTLENTLLQGGDVDPDELQRVQLESQEIALRARIENLTAHLQVIDDEAGKASKGIAAKIASLGSSRFRSLRDASQTIRDELVKVRSALILDQTFAKPKSGDADGLTPPPLDVSAKRDALGKAQSRFARISDDRELGTFLGQAYDAIDSQRLRTAIVNALAMMGVSFVGSAMASVLTKGMGRALMTAEAAKDVASLSMRARAGIFAVRVASDTIVNSAGQVALTGDDPWKALTENLLMSLGAEGTTNLIVKDVGAARAFHQQLAAHSTKIEAAEARAASKLGTATRLIGREALAISGHSIMGMALGALSGKIVAAIEGKKARAGGVGLEDTIIQGASIAIGRLAHARVAERRTSLEELARHSGSSEAKQLVDHAKQLETLSAALTKAPDAQRALDVLAHQERLIQEEIRVLDELAARPDRGGYSADELARTKEELSGQLGNAGDATMLVVKLHLSGLRELAPGTLWSGTPEDVARGVREIQRSRPDARVHQEPGTTTVQVGDRRFEFHEVAGPKKESASGDHAQTRPPEATHELSNAVVRVPGSEMRGGTQGEAKSTEHSQELLARAKATAGTVHVPGVSEIRPSSKSGTYLVMLADSSWTSIEVSIARTDGSNPAQLVPNSSRVNHIDGIAVRGEHVIQLSERLPLDQVDRVVAHGIARLVDAHRHAAGGVYASHENNVLSPDDRGRIAEINVLARTATSSDLAAAGRARSELAMLTEYLGIRDGAPMANERRTAIDAELKHSPEARAELARAIREPLSDAQRKAALDDLSAEQADHQERTAKHDLPPSMATKPGERITREQIAQYADVAARLRHLVSQRTIAKYRAQHAQHPGRYPRIDAVHIGAGAALAGRDPSALLVDARGRWQSDASDNIAQVGQQLQDLYRARFGDVREVAGPGERIPVDAVRYWEDSLASQGDVIDGHGTLRTENDRLLIDIRPMDGSAPLTLEVGGNVVSAPGFPSENIPGGAFGVGAGEAILSIERALTALAEKKGPAGDYATAALARLHEIKTTRDADLSRVGEILRDAPTDVLAELRATKPGDGVDASRALDAVAGRERWENLVNKDKADGDRQIFFSKEANDESIKKSAREHDDKERTWVFAGAGGNAVSAAEIILANTQKAKVYLAARDTPPGLFQNGQFRSMAEKHGDASVAEAAAREGFTIDPSKTSNRLHVELDPNIDLATPTIGTRPDGSQEIVLHGKRGSGTAPLTDKRGHEIKGDMFVSALGSPGQLPPEIGALAMEARRKYPLQANSERAARPVWIEADFSKDGRYLGYTVHIRIGRSHRTFEVRGAASRSPFLPRHEFKRMGADGETDLKKIDVANEQDAHSKSGNFAGGLGPTATQSSQQHVERERKTHE
jgi:hypothetical protein